MTRSHIGFRRTDIIYCRIQIVFLTMDIVCSEITGGLGTIENNKSGDNPVGIVSTFSYQNLNNNKDGMDDCVNSVRGCMIVIPPASALLVLICNGVLQKNF